MEKISLSVKLQSFFAFFEILETLLKLWSWNIKINIQII